MPKAQPDLSEFFRLAKPKRPPCAIGFVLDQLGEPEAGQLKAACEVDAGIINAGAIVKWLRIRGHEISQQRVVNHRRGTCTCYDEQS